MEAKVEIAPQAADKRDFLSAPGEMAALMRSIDWAKTAVGVPEAWPAALRIAVRLLLNCGHPMYIFWGREGTCFYNDAYRRSIGPERHPSSLGRPAREVWDEIWTVIGPQIEQVMEGRGATWHENALVPITRHGRREDVYWTYSYSPIDDPEAQHGVGGVLVVCTETTKAVRAAAGLAREQRRLTDLLNKMPGFAAVLRGPDHVYEYVNEAYLAIAGQRQFLGHTVRDVFPELHGQPFFDLLDRVYSTGDRFVAHGAPMRLAGETQQRFMDFLYEPIRDEQGSISGIFVAGYDVTDARRVEEALAAREEQLRLATEAAEIGLWDVDPVNATLYWPPRVKAMFGISEDVEVSMADFYQGLHPEDREFVSAAYAAAADPDRRALYDVEYRTIGKNDGVLRWVAARGRGVFEQDTCVRMIGTAIDISSRKRGEEALVRSRKALEEEARRKDQFLAVLSHELRNPLAPIRNAIQLLRSAQLDELRRPQVLAIAERQIAHMSRLLDDLLDIARITQGKLSLRIARTQLAEVIETALESARPLLEARHHRFTLNLPEWTIWLEADAVRLSQILANLLVNAAKYTDPGGCIDLSARIEGEMLEVSISDSGIGLDPTHLEGIFEMFAQLPEADRRSEGGLGIGLALVKGLIQLHGGSIVARSEGRGRGSTFVVSLPYVRSLEADGACTGSSGGRG